MSDVRNVNLVHDYAISLYRDSASQRGLSKRKTSRMKTSTLMPLFMLLVGLTAQALYAGTTREWTGAVDSNWSSDANWNPVGKPLNGDSLVLSGAGPNRPTNQDLAGLTLEALRFDSTTTAALVVTGQTLTLTGENGLTVEAGQHRLAIDLTISANQVWSIAQDSSLDIAGHIKDQSPQLAAHYTFDEVNGADISDASGAGNPGTLKGTTATRIPGIVGSGALEFGNASNRDGYVDIPSFTWPGTGDPVTVSFWINIPTGGNSGVSNLFGVGDRDDAGDNPDLHRFATHAPWNDNTVYWDYGHYNGPNDEGRVSANLPRRDDWIHVAFVSSGTTSTFMGIYFDGTLAVSQPRSSAPLVTLTGMMLGRSPDFAWYQSGKLDDFRIYKGLLSASQVAQLAAKNDPSFTSGQSVTKSGAGTLFFSNSNTYSGGTAVSSGSLVALNTSGSATGTGNLTVASTGTLSGSGTISGAVTVEGTVTPGAAMANTLTIQNAILFRAGSTLQSALTSANGGAATRLSANGVTLEVNVNLAITIDTANRANAPYTLIQNTGSTAIVGTFLDKPNGAAFSTGGVSFISNYAGGAGNDFTLLDDTPQFATHPVAQTIDVGVAPTALTAIDSTGDTLTFSIVSGSLPPGLTLSQSGAFGGIASSTAVGEYTSRVRVTDAAGGYDEADLVITVKNVVYSVLDLSVAENAGVAHVVISRDGGLGQTTTIQVHTEALVSPIAATASIDYMTTSLTIQFDPQQTTRTFDVPLFDDTLAEGNEIFGVKISNASVGNIDRADAIVTITDDEPVPVVSLLNSTLNVGEAGGSVTLRASLDSPSSGTVNVSFSTANGTATGSSDFTAAQGTLTWNAGESGERTITVNILDDLLAENTETFSVTLSNPLRCTIGTSTAIVAIVDDEPLPTFSIADLIVNESIGLAEISVNLRTASDHVLTLDYTTVDGTALAGIDYQAISGTLQWAAGETDTKTFTITILDDLLADSGEVLLLRFFNATIPAAIETPQASLRVIDNDIGPSANPDDVLTPQNQSISIAVLTNDTGLIHKPLRVTLAQTPVSGTAIVNSDDTITYSPASEFNGVDSFVYIVTDDLGQSSLATVTISVRPPPSFLSLPTITPNPCIAGTTVLASTAIDFGSVTWDWGDGSLSSGLSSSHVYSFPGIYTLSVTILSADGIATTHTSPVFVSMALDGIGDNGNGGGATPPGVTGILVGGAGAGKNQGASGKIRCNYIRRDKTTLSGSLCMLSLPAELTQSDLASQAGKLRIGAGPTGAQFAFMLGKTGRSRATGLPQIEFSVKKKRFKFKAQRADLADLTEALGGARQFETKKGEQIVIQVPVTLQVGNLLFLALTFELNYQQVGTGGKGNLTE